jgi:GT2 family glycosyltransferase
MRIVIATEKSKEEYFDSTSGKCLAKLQKVISREQEGYDIYNFDITVLANNKKGLSHIYNAVLETDPHNDIILFMHDDVEIHDAFFVEKLKKAHETYDIVGLAGATSQNYKTSFGGKHLWHLSSNDGRKHLRGIVAHYFPEGYYNSMFFGRTPAEVSVIDGLFMSVKTSALKDKKLFDEDFDFHHYDMAMCINAKAQGLKIGVWPIFVIHHGLGEFDNEIWNGSNETFKKKYLSYETETPTL